MLGSPDQTTSPMDRYVAHPRSFGVRLMRRILLDLPKLLPRQRSFPSGFQQEIRSSRILHLLDGKLGNHVWIGFRNGNYLLMAWYAYLNIRSFGRQLIK